MDAQLTTCGRGARTHGDVLNLHTEIFWTDTRGRGKGGGKEGEEVGVTVSSANHETAHVELSRASERFTERNPWFLPIQGLRTSREQHVPESSNHSLYLIRLFSFSNLEGNCGGNQHTHTTHTVTNTKTQTPTQRNHTTHTTHTYAPTHTHQPTHQPTHPPPLLSPPSPSPSHTHTQTHMYMHVFMYMHVCMCICVCICICICVCFCVRVCICVCICICA